MVIGFAAQEAMSLVIAAIFVLAAIRLSILRRRPVYVRRDYGVGIFLVMNLVVVPLSAAFPKHRPIHLDGVLLNLAAMILFGLIIAMASDAPFVMRGDRVSSHLSIDRSTGRHLNDRLSSRPSGPPTSFSGPDWVSADRQRQCGR